MNSIAEFEAAFGADAPLAIELILATDEGLPVVHSIVKALKSIYGSDVPDRPEYPDRLRESVRVLKALEAHGLMHLPEGLFV